MKMELVKYICLNENTEKIKHKKLVIYTIYNGETLFLLIYFNSFSKEYELICNMYKWLMLCTIR